MAWSYKKNDQGEEHPIAFMTQILLDDELKYSDIENNTYELVKLIEQFWCLIIGKHTKVRVSFRTMKDFLLRLCCLRIWFIDLKKYKNMIYKTNRRQEGR